jgi:hypothetical protein
MAFSGCIDQRLASLAGQAGYFSYADAGVGQNEDVIVGGGGRIELLGHLNEGHVVLIEQFHQLGEVRQRACQAVMKRTRHQLAPAMPDQKIIDRSRGGLRKGHWSCNQPQHVDVQHLAGACSSGKTR